MNPHTEFSSPGIAVLEPILGTLVFWYIQDNPYGIFVAELFSCFPPCVMARNPRIMASKLHILPYVSTSHRSAATVEEPPNNIFRVLQL